MSFQGGHQQGNRSQRTLLLLLAAAAGGCGARTRANGPEPQWESVRVLLVAAGQGCQTDQPPIMDEVSTSVHGASLKLRALGFSNIVVVQDPAKEQVTDALALSRTTPFVLWYVGHASLHQRGSTEPLTQCSEEGERCVSSICLRDGPLAIDDLIAALPARNPLTVMVFDACASAHVDVRSSKANFSIISASPVTIRTFVEGTTVFGKGLADVTAAELDGDCSGAVSDVELFDALLPHLAQGQYRLAQPKLVRHVWHEIPLLNVRQGSCVPRRATPSAPRFVRTWYGSEPRLAVNGYLGADEPIAEGGETYAPDMLIPMPCETSHGQCFRVRTGTRP